MVRYSQDHTESFKMPGSNLENSEEDQGRALNGTNISSMIRKNQNDKSREDKHATLIFAPQDDSEE